MRLRHSIALLVIPLLFIALTPDVSAQQYYRNGPYEIHYNAFNSTSLPPEIADKYRLVRSKYRALVNITVLQVDDEGNRKAVRAVVKGYASNDVEQHQTLGFHPVSEGQEVYYLSSFRFQDGQPLKLHIEVQADPNKPPYSFSFNKTFYGN